MCARLFLCLVLMRGIDLTILYSQLAMQVASLGLLLSGALIMYKSCMLITNSESPIVVVLRCVLSVGVSCWRRVF